MGPDPRRTSGTPTRRRATSRRSSRRAGEARSASRSCAAGTAAGRCSAGWTGLLEQTSERARAELATLAAGRRRGRGLPRRRRCELRPAACASTRGFRVRRGRLEVDVSGSSPQVPSSLNVPWASTHAAAYFAVRCFIGADVPQNDGLTRHVRIACPEGSILRPTLPGGGLRAPSHRPAALRGAVPGARRAPARPRSRVEPRVVPGVRVPGGRPPQRTPHPPHRHPRRRGWCPPRGAGRPRDRLLHLELRAPSGRDRRDRVPVSHRAHGARPRLGRRGGAARRARPPARLPPARRCRGGHVLRRAARPAVRRSGRRRWRPRRPGARPDPPRRRPMADREPGQGLSAPPPRGRRLVRGRRWRRLRDGARHGRESARPGAAVFSRSLSLPQRFLTFAADGCADAVQARRGDCRRGRSRHARSGAGVRDQRRVLRHRRRA